MADRTQCLDPAQMQQFLNGADDTLDPDWAAHLEGCAGCRQCLEELAGTISASEVAERLTAHGFEEEAPLKQALATLKTTVRPAARPPGDAAHWFRSFLQPSGNSENLGRLGDYEIVKLLGQGGMGFVFLAFEPALRRQVAIKVLSPHLASDSLARERFAREGQAAAAVRHENVVAIHAVEEANGLPFIVMEYVSGGSLQRFLRQYGPVGPETVVRLGLAVAAGLEAAHLRGLVHRDVKPANLLIVPQVEAPASAAEAEEKRLTPDSIRHIKITDFGLARLADDSRLTQSGVVAGTPSYMSPEQAAGLAVDSRADLFSLGSVLYVLATGREPFVGATPLSILHEVCHAHPTPVRELNPTFPEWLSDLIERLHAKLPDERIASASEVLAALTTGLTQPPDKSNRFFLYRWFKRKKIKRRGRARWLIAGSLLLAGTVSASLFVPGAYLPWSRGPVREAVSSLPQLVFKGHGGPVRSMSFAADGSLLAVGSDDGALRTWESVTGQLVSELTGHEGAVYWVNFSRSGSTLVSGGDGTLRIWNTSTWKESNVIRREGGARRGALSPDGTMVAVCGSAREVDLYSVADGLPHGHLTGHTGTVSSMTFNNDGQLLATGDSRGYVKFWSPGGTEVGNVRADRLGVRALAFSPDGQSLATSGTSKPGVSMWSVLAGEARENLDTPGESVLSLAFSPDGQYVAGGGQDGTLFLWGLKGAPPIVVPHAHQGRIFSVAFQPNGKALATGGEDRRIAIWEMSKLIALRP
jgi:serine/threonine protein kinase